MGKKRNNAAKKKKGTKKQHLSATFGVSVLKGGSILRNNGVIDKKTLADGNHAQSKNKKNGISNATATPSAAALIYVNEQSSTAHEITGNRPSNSSENDEFRHASASLEERQLALQSRQKECQKKKRGRKSQKKGWGKFAHPSTKVEFTSATLNLGPKSTEQLINEAADHVAMGMADIGQSSAASNHYTAGSSTGGQSSLSAAAGLNWKMQASVNNLVQQPPPPEQNNAFAAFEEDIDSDNEWSEGKVEPTPQFQFQPASFSFQAAPSVAQHNEDVDPDL